MGVPVRNFLKTRRDRVLGTILGHAERNIYPLIPVVEQRAFRSVVLEAINTYHDTVLDLVKSDDDESGVRNELVNELLERMRATLG